MKRFFGLIFCLSSSNFQGFYAVYQKLFKDLSEEDYTFMNADDEDYPQFGDSETDVEWVVSEFYGFWSSFATKKSYVWEEEWDTRWRLISVIATIFI